MEGGFEGEGIKVGALYAWESTGKLSEKKQVSGSHLLQF